jgi:hypothetical protein
MGASKNSNTRISHPSQNDLPSLHSTIKLLVVLASFTSGDQHIFEIVALYRPPPHQD